MNKDQVQGAAKISVGKIQREVGKLVGSRKEQIRGIGKQIEGEVQQRYGEVKDAARTSRNKPRR